MSPDCVLTVVRQDNHAGLRLVRAMFVSSHTGVITLVPLLDLHNLDPASDLILLRPPTGVKGHLPVILCSRHNQIEAGML